PDPAVAGPVQWANAAAAIAALHALSMDETWLGPAALAAAATLGLRNVHVPGRLQVLGGDPAVIVDVGHNPQAARVLAQWLDGHAPRRVHAVYGAMADKDVAGVVAALGKRIAHWHLGGLEQETSRGMASAALAAVLHATLPEARFDAYADIREALTAACSQAQAGEWILAFGSFHVARAALSAHEVSPGMASGQR
ncbi:MAG: cyanophycin synthetase, partial [Rhodanobacter sp.]